MDRECADNEQHFELNRIIDHTLLRPNARRAEMEAFLADAARYHFVTVAVLPTFVKLSSDFLAGSDVNVMAAIGYPRGMAPLSLKRLEIEDAIANGATELDMVLDLEAIKRGDIATTEKEISMLRTAGGGMTVKTILEATLLSDEEIAVVCRIASDAGIDFVKSSTGFNGHAASEHAVCVMRAHVFGRTRVKAAGGIRDMAGVVRMVRSGASRIGTSQGPAIMDEFVASGCAVSAMLMEFVK